MKSQPLNGNALRVLSRTIVLDKRYLPGWQQLLVRLAATHHLDSKVPLMRWYSLGLRGHYALMTKTYVISALQEMITRSTNARTAMRGYAIGIVISLVLG